MLLEASHSNLCNLLLKRLIYLDIILEYFYMEYFPFIGIDREEERQEEKDEEDE